MDSLSIILPFILGSLGCILLAARTGYDLVFVPAWLLLAYCLGRLGGVLKERDGLRHRVGRYEEEEKERWAGAYYEEHPEESR